MTCLENELVEHLTDRLRVMGGQDLGRGLDQPGGFPVTAHHTRPLAALTDRFRQAAEVRAL